MRTITWSIADIVNLLTTRQRNEFDGNFLVSGERGNGKSTLIAKILYRFSQFKPWTHQVYGREELIALLKTQKYGLAWDDEAVNSGYKRNFQSKAQQELIKMVTMYRDNFNIYASAIPNFFSLDKDLRDLTFLHLHVVERGLAIVHMPLQGRLYSTDKWDSANNGKIESKWVKRLKKDANFKPPFSKLTTFRGYLFFSDLTTIQKKLYKEIKAKKRKELYGKEKDVVEEDPEIQFYDRLSDLAMQFRLSRKELINFCYLSGKKYETAKKQLSLQLAKKGCDYNLKDLLNMSSKSKAEEAFIKKNLTVRSPTLAKIDGLVPQL